MSDPFKLLSAAQCEVLFPGARPDAQALVLLTFQGVDPAQPAALPGCASHLGLHTEPVYALVDFALPQFSLGSDVVEVRILAPAGVILGHHLVAQLLNLREQ